MDIIKRGRGRPSIAIDGTASVTSMVPVGLHVRLCRVCFETGQSLSALVRRQLISIQNAVDIMPMMLQMQADRDEALEVAKEAIALAQESEARLQRVRELIEDLTHSAFASIH